MKRKLTYQVLLLLGFIISLAPLNYAQEVSFIENKGQILNQFGEINNEVKYLLSTPQYNVSFYSDHFAYEIFSPSKKDSSALDVERIELWFNKTNEKHPISSSNPTNDITNVYKKGKSTLDIKGFNTITYNNVWEGVDVEFLTQNNQLKYNYIVKNRKIKSLTLTVKGASASVKNSNIILQGENKFITETIPECYYISQNNEKEFSSIHVKASNKSIQYNLPSSRQNTFVIDPLAYGDQYTTYYGGTHMDFAHSIETTKTNEVIIAGYTLSTTNIATTGAYQTTISTQDAFIAKFDDQGNRLWATYFGGNDEERVYTMALDTNENIIIAGNTTSTLGLATAGAQQLNIVSSDDAFVAQFSPTGQLVWCTYFGGNNHELIAHVETDSQNKIYVTGHTSSSDLPCTPNAFRSTLSGFENTFLGVYNNAGTLLYNSYYMNGSSNIGEGIAISNDGTIYFAGTTNDTTTIPNTSVHQNQTGGLLDGFVIKISPTFQTIWKTYFGGSQNDLISGMAMDSLQNLYLVGKTKSNNSISTTGSYQSIYASDWDGFVVKLDSSSSQIWGTYLGDVSIDELSAVSQKDSTLWVLGFTNGNLAITDSSATQQTNQGGVDNIILKFNLDGNKIWATYLGGTNDEFGRDLTVDSTNNVFIVGQTASATNFTTSNAHQIAYGGHVYDGFWTKLCKPIAPTLLTASGEVFICTGDSILVNSINSFTSYSWNTGESSTSLNIQASGNYVLNTIDANGCPGRSDTLKITVVPTQAVSILSTSNVICFEDSLLLSVDNIYSSYLWNNGNTTVDQFVTDTGAYYASVIDIYGCEHTSDTIELTTNQYSFNIEIVGDTLVCVNGSSILFTSEIFSVINWNTSENTSSITVDTTGGYYFSGIDTNNCPIVSDTISITEISYTSSGLVLDTVSLFQICWNDSITLIAESNFNAYLWSNGDTNQIISMNAEGYYYVSATDSNGCVGISDSVQITHFNDGSTDISFPFGLSFCEGDNIALVADAALTNISWNNSPLNSSLLTIDTSGTYFFSATDLSNCSIFSDTISTTMFALPQVNFNTQPDSICIDDSVLIACTSSNISNYNWSNGETDSSFYTSYTDTGDYFLTVEISDGNNCVNNGSVEINVIDCIYESLDENILSHFVQVSPNPSSSAITLSSPISNFKFEIINIHGQVIMDQTTVSTKTFIVDISRFAPGTYFIKLILQNATETVSFVKL